MKRSGPSRAELAAARLGAPIKAGDRVWVYWAAAWAIGVAAGPPDAHGFIEFRVENVLVMGAPQTFGVRRLPWDRVAPVLEDV